MKDSSKTQSTLGAAAPESDPTRRFSEREKKSLELARRAEHGAARRWEFLQAEARRRAENG